MNLFLPGDCFPLPHKQKFALGNLLKAAETANHLQTKIKKNETDRNRTVIERFEHARA